MFWEYLLRLKFTVYTKNNALAYIKTSKLGMSQFCWLRKLALFNINTQYHVGKTHKAADALSQCLVNTEFEMEDDSDNDSKDPVVLSYVISCGIMGTVLKDTKIPYTIKKEVQAISNALEGEVSTNIPELPDVPNLTVQTNAVLTFDQVSLANMAKAQTKDSALELVIQYVFKGDKLKGFVISNICSKAVCKYLLQLDWLVLKQGVLHSVYIFNDVE